jgi:hypothetical protein
MNRFPSAGIIYILNAPVEFSGRVTCIDVVYALQSIAYFILKRYRKLIGLLRYLRHCFTPEASSETLR